MSNRDKESPKSGVVLKSRTRRKTTRPRMYRVLLHNDDYTPMDFVVDVLESLFGKSPAEAYRVMMLVHNTGVGMAGVYPHEVAETKVQTVHQWAKEAGHPLRASLEEE